MAFQLRHKCSIGYVAMKVNTDKNISNYSIKGGIVVYLKLTSSSKKLTIILIRFLANVNHLNAMHKDEYRRFDEQKIISYFLCTGAL